MNQLTDLKAILHYWNIPITKIANKPMASNLHSSVYAVLSVIIKKEPHIAALSFGASFSLLASRAQIPIYWCCIS
jgi:hypothetical protein